MTRTEALEMFGIRLYHPLPDGDAEADDEFIEWCARLRDLFEEERREKNATNRCGQDRPESGHCI